MSILHNVRAEVARAGLTQQQIADELGLHRTGVSRRMTGVTPWHAVELLQLARVLNVEPAVLVGPGPYSLDDLGVAVSLKAAS